MTHVSDPVVDVDGQQQPTSDSATIPTSKLYSLVDCRFYRTGYMEASSYFKEVLLQQLLHTVEGLATTMQGPQKYSVYEAMCSTMN